MAVIFAFGDSITYGSWDTVNGGWCSLLRKHVDQKNAKDPTAYIRLYNLGIPGDTTVEAVERFLPETKARLRDKEGNVFVFAFGTNDACYIPHTGKFVVPVEQFTQNIELLVSEAKKISQDILLLTIPPVVDAITEQPSDSGDICLNKYFEPYNRALVAIADKHGVTLIDINKAFTATDYKALLDQDGLHPNTEGYKLMFQMISTEIDKVLSAV